MDNVSVAGFRLEKSGVISCEYAQDGGSSMSVRRPAHRGSSCNDGHTSTAISFASITYNAYGLMSSESTRSPHHERPQTDGHLCIEVYIHPRLHCQARKSGIVIRVYQCFILGRTCSCPFLPPSIGLQRATFWILLPGPSASGFGRYHSRLTSSVSFQVVPHIRCRLASSRADPHLPLRSQ